MTLTAREIIIKLASFQDVSYEHFPNSSRFKIISKNGLKWSSRASKLGNIHYSDDHLYLALDYPSGKITESDILKKLNLPKKNPGDKKSGFYVIQDRKFDTVRISLYQDKLADQKYLDKTLIDFAEEILNTSKGK